MDDDDNAELGALLGSLSAGGVRIASDALDRLTATSPAPRRSGGADLDWLVQAVVDALTRDSGGALNGRRSGSTNQIAAIVARAVQRGVRFT